MNRDEAFEGWYFDLLKTARGFEVPYPLKVWHRETSADYRLQKEGWNACHIKMSKPQPKEQCPHEHPMWALRVCPFCDNPQFEPRHFNPKTTKAGMWWHQKIGDNITMLCERECSLCVALAAREREGLLKAVKVICPACSAGSKVTRVTSKITGRTIYYHEGLANCQASDIHRLLAEAGKP